MKITTKFQTYRTTGYTFQIAGSDPRSTGGVHLHQIRKAGNGYLVRIVQSNGRFSDAGPSKPATKEEIEDALASDE